MLNFFSFHLISSHRSVSWKLLTASHCHRSLRHPISSQLISCLLSFFPYIISALRSSCHLISACLMSFHFLRNQFDLFWYFMVVHLMSKHLIPHQNLFPKPNKTPQQLFPCRLHKKFKVVVSGVSDPWVHWDTHSKPARREVPTQKGFYTATLLHTANFHQKFLHTENSLHMASFYTEQALTLRNFHTEKLYTEKHLHREDFAHSKLLN